MGISTRLSVLLTSLLVVSSLKAASPQESQTPAASPPAPSEAGIPISDKTVQTACSPCHRPDAQGVMSRISFRRTTPEGWEETVRRMVSLNGVKLEPATAREVVRYLSNNLGLAPEEVKPAAFEVERRPNDFKYEASRDTEQVCSACHSIGRAMLQRRSKEDWHMLVDMHRGWYPLTDFQAFRRMGPPQREPGPDGRPPDNRHPVEKALEHLTSAYPLYTPEWAAWSATMRPPRLDGVWTVSGYETGKGPLYGTLRIAHGASPDEVTTDASYTYARSGERVSRKGRAVIYTGHQWRGRSSAPGSSNGNSEDSLREVMSVERDWQTIAGRWFTGGYDERGIDVTLRRAGNQPVVLGTSPTALRVGGQAQTVRLFASGLASTLTAKDIDFGPGVSVSTVSGSSADGLTITVDVAERAAIGPRDIVVAGAVKPAAVVVYDKVDYIKVTPEWAMARVGGVTYPKGLAFFEATAYHNGRDGKSNTKDDISLGLVNATWGLEEYSAILNDDDIKYVGAIDQASGVFTPNAEGPNPQRMGRRNNVGDVWVVASYTPTGAKQPLRARAHLLVTVPLYMRWGVETQTVQ